MNVIKQFFVAATLVALTIGCGGTTVAGGCESSCSGDTPVTCDDDGKPIVGTPCSDSEQCFKGTCIPDSTDASNTDTGTPDTGTPDTACVPDCAGPGSCGDDGCGGLCPGGEDCSLDPFNLVGAICAPTKQCIGIGDHCWNPLDLPQTSPTIYIGKGSLTRKAELDTPGCDSADYPCPMGMATDQHQFSSNIQCTDKDLGNLNAPVGVPEQVWSFTASKSCNHAIALATSSVDSLYLYITSDCPGLDNGCLYAKKLSYVGGNTANNDVVTMEGGRTYFFIVEPSAKPVPNSQVDYELTVREDFQSCSQAEPSDPKDPS